MSRSKESAFNDALEIGKIGESEVAKYLKSRGHHILPIYEIKGGEFEGPVLYAADGRKITAPDMVCINEKGIKLIEVKAKNAWTKNNNLGVWNTGIDLKLLRHYNEMEKLTGWPVWIFFLQKGGQAKDSPPDSPPGLYIGLLSELLKVGRFHKNGGKNGMIYWMPEHFYKLSEYPFPDAN